MRLAVDLQVCQGHGKCYMSAPALFEPDESDDWGRPRVLQADIDPGAREIVEAARVAVNGCPEQAITLSD